MASAGVPGFKEAKATLKILRIGGKALGVLHNDQYTKCQQELKKELRELADSKHTDTNHLRILIERFAKVAKESANPIDLCKSQANLVKALREGTDIPFQSKLPDEFAAIINQNVKKLFSSADWDEAIFDKVAAESQKNIEGVKKATGQVINELEYKGSFQEYLDHAVLPANRPGYESRFLYLNDTLSLYGRETEKANIERFLRSEERISVWAICGQGGVGKSKLARHICQTYSEFKFVWLDEDEFSKIAAIQSGYSTDNSVVFICDYADEKGSDLLALIKRINNSEIKKARFLLLSRDENWFPRFVCTNSLQGIGYKQSAKYESLNLSQFELGKEVFGQILDEFQKKYYPEHAAFSPADIDIILNNVNRAVPTNSQNVKANRCLFVLIFADCFLQDSESVLNSLDELLRYFFERSKEHLAHCDEAYTPAMIESGVRLLALATALRGFRLNDNTLPEFMKADITEIKNVFGRNKQKIVSFWNKITDNSFSDDTIHPYEPDLIGEYLFLWQFFDNLMDDEPRKWCEYLIERVENGDNSVEVFINRCAADWPEYGNDRLNFFSFYSRVQQEMHEREAIHA